MLLHRLTAPAIAVALAAAACGPSDPDHTSFGISIGFSVDYHGCPADTCAFYATACGAKMSVRLVDADTGELLTSDCVDLDGADLCAISQAEVELDAVRPGMARIEVALWNPSDLIDGRCPNDDIFDRQPLGAPREDYLPQPALGGATFFQVGSQANVEVMLACGDYQHLDEATCKRFVTARVDDLSSSLFVPGTVAENFTVAVGEPTIDSDNGEVRWLLGPDELTELQRTDGIALPVWTGELPGPLVDDACVAVVDDSEFQPVTTVACIPAPEELDDPLLGLYVDKDTMEKLLQAAMFPSFPEQGLVIGRVVDHLEKGIANVRVTPTGGGVEYLNEDGTSFLNTTETASDGYFISRDAPFGAVWTALHTDGRTEDSVYTAGLIVGKASVVLIRLQEPL